MTTNTNQSINTVVFCKQCAYFHTRLLKRDGLFDCTFGASLDIVTGTPVVAGLPTCYEARARNGHCGPEGRNFNRSPGNFNRLFNPADLTVDGHGLNESSQQDGVLSGVSITENAVDFINRDAQVLANDMPSLNGPSFE